MPRRMKENEQIVKVRALDAFVRSNRLAQVFERRRGGIDKNLVRRAEEEWVFEYLWDLRWRQDT